MPPVTDRRLTWPQRRLLGLLGFPAFGLAVAYTVVGTYLPLLLNDLSGPAVTGLLIGSEGLLALFIPLLIGSWSEATRSRLGRRLPFILAGSALMIPALVVMPVGDSLLPIALALTVFFVGYFVYYTPYYALYPDLVPLSARGRSQGVQGVFRSAGLLLALSGGGLLFAIGPALPFLVAVAALLVVTAGLLVGLRHRVRDERRAASTRAALRAAWLEVRASSAVRAWMLANGLWEGAVAALKTFVVLYFTQGLGATLERTAGALALVGIGALIAAPVAGALADRLGHQRVMLVAAWAFAIGLLPGLLTTDELFVIAVVPVAFAAVVLVTLPFSLLMGLLPGVGQHGAAASLFGMSRGLGILLGPLLAGLAIQATRSLQFGALEETNGYAAAFAVAAVLLLCSIPVLARIK